jgi:hypothetical protein
MSRLGRCPLLKFGETSDRLAVIPLATVAVVQAVTARAAATAALLPSKLCKAVAGLLLVRTAAAGAGHGRRVPNGVRACRRDRDEARELRVISRLGRK